MFADCPAIEAVFARAGGKGLGEGDPIRRASAILYQGAHVVIRLTGESDSEGTIGETADGFLKPVSRDLLHRSENERLKSCECHCRISSGALGIQ
jgi:hypothetical protein